MSSLENFYAKFEKQILLTSSFTDNKLLSKIITMCRLKPHDLIFGDFSIHEMKLHYHWIDEWGNSLFIEKNKNLKLQLNNLLLNQEKIVKTDLYGNLSLEKIASISKLVFYLDGKDEDFFSPYIILGFVGIDNFLRAHIFIYGEWKPCPPLYLGLEILSTIVDNYDLQYCKKINVIKNVIHPCDSQRAFLSCWPPTNDFVSKVAEQNEFVLATLNIKKGKL